MADVEAPKKKSDLPVRFASAVVMLAVAGTALWLGGVWWTLFVAVVGLGVLWEWSQLAFAVSPSQFGRISWILAGGAYIGLACFVLYWTRLSGGGYWHPETGLLQTIMIVTVVIGVDVGAYFAGRAIGGPKIAPSISPSKTWAGLFGGMIGAFVALCASIYAGGMWIIDMPDYLEKVIEFNLIVLIVVSVLAAIVAQSGDFFESWMKRRAGVKDSSNLIPGHGGLFDRVDGLLAICFSIGLVLLVLFRMHTP